MLLENKTALIYGAGGAIGGAVARTFAREGARAAETAAFLASDRGSAMTGIVANLTGGLIVD